MTFSNHQVLLTNSTSRGTTILYLFHFSAFRRAALARQIRKLLTALHSSQRNRLLGTLPHIAHNPLSLRFCIVGFFVIARPTRRKTSRQSIAQ